MMLKCGRCRKPITSKKEAVLSPWAGSIKIITLIGEFHLECFNQLQNAKSWSKFSFQSVLAKQSLPYHKVINIIAVVLTILVSVILVIVLIFNGKSMLAKPMDYAFLVFFLLFFICTPLYFGIRNLMTIHLFNKLPE